MSQVSYLTIDKNYELQRLDNFLACYLKGVPKGHIYRIIRTGEVRINKARVKPCYRLNFGDEVRLPPIAHQPKQEPAELNTRVLERAQKAHGDLKQAILYQDKYYLILNKPSGLASHGGSGLKFGAIEALRHLFPELAADLALGHRLDRDTSGCLVLAKTRRALRALHALFREKRIEKSYIALCHNVDNMSDKYALEGQQVIAAPLQKETTKSGERLMKVHVLGEQAKTIFKLVSKFSTVSLFDITPVTGKMHQIRVHAAYAEHPIVGDDKYGRRYLDQALKLKLEQDEQQNFSLWREGLSRLFLHAQKISFECPISGQRIQAVAPMDPGLAALLQRLK